MRYRATLAYDGTRFHGFQRQANARPTVQGEVEGALGRISGQTIRVLGAGRTDAGVHARGQVIAFDLSWRHPKEALRDALNACLPADIAVLDVREAAPGFHPRYDALSRSYMYRVRVAPVRDPLERLLVWHLIRPLDLEPMQAAAACLLGEHDFSAFGTPPQGESPVRCIGAARWEEGPDGLFTFTITANAFLYRMVRTIVGTLVLVGRGQMTDKAFEGILAARRRSQAGTPAPAQGLTLVSVQYEE